MTDIQTKIIKSGYKEQFLILIALLFLTDLVILLNIPFLRQILGFLLLTILPGLLILYIFKLNEIGFSEKFILVWGLSISFLMFFGLIINNLLLQIGYETPLATIPLLIAFNAMYFVLAIIGYELNKKNTSVSLFNLNLTLSEKVFLIVPILFPALSIFGMHIMNTTDNNIVLMLLLFSIPIYVAFVCIFNQKVPSRIYPVVIFLISISLLLLLALRSDHVIGVDTHTEYYIFQTTLSNLHWTIHEYSTLNACLSISLLPTIYHSLLNVPSEFLFKILYSLLFSITPVIIYIISRKYVDDSYAFLVSCFFMSQAVFLRAEAHSRTIIAVMFFALAMMVLFSDKIERQKKSALFIVFMFSCIVSHYTTTYIFLFILIGVFLGLGLLSTKYTFKNKMSLTIVLLFFVLIFFWYSQVTEAAFNAGVSFIGKTLTSLNNMFITEMRTEPIQELLGGKLTQEGLHYKINFFFTWMTFVFIGIGIITLIRRYKEMSFPELNHKKLDFLKQKFDVEYFIITLICTGILLAVILLPYLTVGYDLGRPYAVATVILSIFFVVGGIMLSKQISRISLNKNLSFKKKALPKKREWGDYTLKSTARKSVDGRKGSQVRAYFVILLVLLPYFLCSTGAMYQLFGVPSAITLNSECLEYDLFYMHDQESYSAKWIKNYGSVSAKLYGDRYSNLRLISQGGILSLTYPRLLIEDKKDIKGGYIYLRYTGVVDKKLMGSQSQWHNLSDYSYLFIKKDKIYGNGGSEVYFKPEL